MEQVAAHLLGEMPVLASERAHHVGVADVLQPETVGEVGRDRRRQRLPEADPIVLVEAEGEGDAVVPRPAGMVVLWRRHASMLLGGQRVVSREGHLALDGVGHLGELILEAMGVVVPCDAATLPGLRIARFGALPAALQRMLSLIVERRVLVGLPHLKVVDFFHHRLPESNPRVNKPV